MTTKKFDLRTKDQKINSLHKEALNKFRILEEIIDELKSLGPHSLDGKNALNNVRDWLGMLAKR